MYTISYHIYIHVNKKYGKESWEQNLVPYVIEASRVLFSVFTDHTVFHVGFMLRDVVKVKVYGDSEVMWPETSADWLGLVACIKTYKM